MRKPLLAYSGLTDTEQATNHGKVSGSFEKWSETKMSKTKSNLNEKKATPETNEKMIPLTVRFTPTEAETFRDLVVERGISLSALIRHSACNNVAKCLGDIWYVDRKQAAEIDAHIVTVGNIMRNIYVELHRIGCNYNQEIKLRQIQKKREELAAERRRFLRPGSYDWCVGEEDIALNDEEEKIKASSELLSVDKIDEMLARYEDATRKASEVLWHIRG